MYTLKLEDTMDIPERGIVLICSAIGLEFQLYSLKKLVGSKILVQSIDGPSIECEVIDVSLSFSITERPIVGINIRGRLNLNGIKRDSFIQKF